MMPLTPCAFRPTENLRTLWLISGGRSGIPCLRQYCEYAATFPLSEETGVEQGGEELHQVMALEPAGAHGD